MPTKTKTVRTYGFRVVSNDKWCDRPCVTVRVLARENYAASPINPRTDGENAIWDAPKGVDGLQLSGLTMRFYASDYTDWPVSFRGFEFEDQYFVDAAKAKAISRTFARIERALTKAGVSTYKVDIAAYIETVAKAIGASWWAVETRAGTGWNYESSDWRFLSIEDLKAALRS